MKDNAYLLNNYELKRYKRQISLPSFNESCQITLKSKTVFVGGVGGVGGTCSLYLAAAGIGRLVLAHYGELDLPDLNRQILMSEQLVGYSRVEQAKEAINRLNSSVEIITYNERLTPDNIMKLIKGCDMAISARPNFFERKNLAEACIKTKIPMIDGAMSGMLGHVFSMIPYESACYFCAFPNEDPNWDEFGFSVLGAFSGLIGCIVAVETIKLICNWENPLKGEILWYLGENHEILRVPVPKRRDCKFCGV